MSNKSNIILTFCLITLFFCVFMIGKGFAVSNTDIHKPIQFYPRIYRECLDPIKVKTNGLSMQPFLYEGDVVYFDKVNFSDVALGDVIMFKKDNNKKVSHAVIAIYSDYLLTAGYNNNKQDNRVYPENITHRYCVN